MVRGPHGHEKTGEGILRVRCPTCGNRVPFEPDEKEKKCPHCNSIVKRPKNR